MIDGGIRNNLGILPGLLPFFLFFILIVVQLSADLAGADEGLGPFHDLSVHSSRQSTMSASENIQDSVNAKSDSFGHVFGLVGNGNNATIVNGKGEFTLLEYSRNILVIFIVVAVWIISIRFFNKLI